MQSEVCFYCSDYHSTAVTVRKCKDEKFKQIEDRQLREVLKLRPDEYFVRHESKFWKLNVLIRPNENIYTVLYYIIIYILLYSRPC